MGSAGLSPRRGFKKTEGESQKPDAVDVKPLIVIGVILRDYRAAGCRGPNGKTVKHATPPSTPAPPRCSDFPGYTPQISSKFARAALLGGKNAEEKKKKEGKKTGESSEEGRNFIALTHVGLESPGRD